MPLPSFRDTERYAWLLRDGLHVYVLLLRESTVLGCPASFAGQKDSTNCV
jgi:hypothetical protein